MVIDLDRRPIYPLTIVQDRYNGIYSGAKFTAWNMYPYELPIGATGDDVTCREFWDNTEIPVGLGNTPNDALFSLATILELEKLEKRK
jgi:hypothetical protein